MRTGDPLRIYANPAKPFFYLLIAAGFTVIGSWMLQNPDVRANLYGVMLAYMAVVFFGLGTAVFLMMMLAYGVLRRPVLQIDAQGWRYTAPLIRGGQAVNWQDIGYIGLYRQNLQRHTQFLLVAHAKDPHSLPHQRARAFFARYYPSSWGAALAVPLNTVFMRTTPARAEQLLGRIVTACAFEIQLYGVQVSDGIHDL